MPLIAASITAIEGLPGASPIPVRPSSVSISTRTLEIAQERP
jgi:hypothetical protein